jgi:hypothetical protein
MYPAGEPTPYWPPNLRLCYEEAYHREQQYPPGPHNSAPVYIPLSNEATEPHTRSTHSNSTASEVPTILMSSHDGLRSPMADQPSELAVSETSAKFSDWSYTKDKNTQEAPGPGPGGEI